LTVLKQNSLHRQLNYCEFVKHKENKMKIKINKIAFLLLLLCPSQQTLAGEATDASGNASEMLGLGALSTISAPVLLSAGVVSLAGAFGVGVGELSGEIIDSLYSVVSSGETVFVNTSKGKKSIPFVVRKDYVQLNERV